MEKLIEIRTVGISRKRKRLAFRATAFDENKGYIVDEYLARNTDPRLAETIAEKRLESRGLFLPSF